MADPNNGGNFANVYTDRAQYDAAMADWQRKKAAGDPFPGPMPRLDVQGQIEDRMSGPSGINFPKEIKNASMWQQMAQSGANAADRANPYNAGVADRSRGAQLALMQQMRGMQSGPSIANMQGQRAMGQMGQQALMQGGRGAMLGAQMGAGGLAGDMGQARLAEMMRSQAGIGGAAGNLRGNDLRSADAQMQAALQQRRQDDMLRQFYASQGSGLAEAQARLGLEDHKLRKRLELQGQANDIKKANAAAGILAPIINGFT